MLNQDLSALPKQICNEHVRRYVPAPVPQSWTKSSELLTAYEIDGLAACVTWIDDDSLIKFCLLEFRYVTDADGNCICPAALKILSELRRAFPALYVERNYEGDGWNIVTAPDDVHFSGNRIYLTGGRHDTAPHLNICFGMPWYFIPTGSKLEGSKSVPFDDADIDKRVRWLCTHNSLTDEFFSLDVPADVPPAENPREQSSEMAVAEVPPAANPREQFEVPTREQRIEAARNFVQLIYSRVPAGLELHSYLFFIKEILGKGGETIKRTDKHCFKLGDADAFQAALATAFEKNDDGWNVYVSVNLSKKSFADVENRANKGDIDVQTALVADIDCESVHHVSREGKRYVPDVDTAAKLLPAPPSIQLDTGGGLHAWYLLAEPLIFDSDAARETASKRNKALTAVIRRKGSRYDSIDGVDDLPRVMRVPGTVNHNEGGALCRVIFDDGETFTPDKIEEIIRADSFAATHNLEPAPPPCAPREKSDTQGATPEFDLYRVREMLTYINPAKLGYEQWTGVGMAMKNVGLTAEDFEEFSKPDERYKVGEPSRKWDTFTGTGLTIATIAQLAELAGYDAKQCWQNFLADNPQCRRSTTRAKKSETRSLYHIAPELADKIMFGGGSDYSNASRFCMAFGDRIRYVADENLWAIYDGGVWKLYDGDTTLLPFANALTNFIKQHLPPEPQVPEAKYSSDGDDAQRAKFDAQCKEFQRLKKSYDDAVSLAAVWCKAKKIREAIFLLKGRPQLRVFRADFDNVPFMLNCPNGVINLKTGKLEPHNPALLLTRQIAIEYHPAAKSDIFGNFMVQILPDDDTRAFMLRWFGYCLAGYPCEEKAVYIHGGGRNGKGTLLKALAPCFGGYFVNLRISALLQRKFDNDDGQTATPEINKLEGARIAVAEEIPDGKRLDAAKFKLLTGRDKIPARRLHHEAHEFEPTFALVLSGNHLPRLSDAREISLTERIVVVRFPNQFTGENCNPNLKKQLAAPDCQQAILATLVRECVAWYRQLEETQRTGLLTSAEIQRETKKYFDDNDFISEFAETWCIFDADARVTVKDFTAKLKSESLKAQNMPPRKLANLIIDWTQRTAGVEYRKNLERDADRFKYCLFGIGILDEPNLTPPDIDDKLVP